MGGVALFPLAFCIGTVCTGAVCVGTISDVCGEVVTPVISAKEAGRSEPTEHVTLPALKVAVTNDNLLMAPECPDIGTLNVTKPLALVV
jgi:hypothetical protein